LDKEFSFKISTSTKRGLAKGYMKRRKKGKKTRTHQKKIEGTQMKEKKKIQKELGKF